MVLRWIRELFELKIMESTYVAVPDNDVLQSWCSVDALGRCKLELQALIDKARKAEGLRHYKWSALCFWRDVRALRAARPPHGISEMPSVLCACREFEYVLDHELQVLERHLGFLCKGLPFSKCYGAWEGGLPSNELSAAGESTNFLKAKLCAMNVRGAFRLESAFQERDFRILQIINELHTVGALLAIVSDPQLGPGAPWPDWTGYVFVGARSAGPDSVGLLILQDAELNILLIEGVGDDRACWVELRLCSGGPCTLVLGVYGYHAGYGAALRREFWQKRWCELRSLRAKPKFSQSAIIIAGDFNLHFGELSSANSALECAVDREVLREAVLYGLHLVNPMDTPTHVSGTTIDVVLASSGSVEKTTVSSIPRWSDHARVDVTMVGQARLVGSTAIGKARWGVGAKWDGALECLTECLSFVAGWAAVAMRHAAVRSWVASGQKRALRQRMVDMAVWWRSALYTVSGHVFGLVVAVGPDSNGKSVDTLKELWEAFDDTKTAGDWKLEWLEAQDMAHRNQKAFYRYLDLCKVSPGHAEAYLGGLLKPRQPVTLALQGPDGLLSPAQAVAAVTKDVVERGRAAEEGDPVMLQAVRAGVKRVRKIAQAASLEEVGDPFSMKTVMEMLVSIKPGKRAVRLPRSALKAELAAACLCAWALCNLVVTVGLVPTAWLREVSPLRKRGPKVVTSTVNLRPVSYVDDLQGLTDALFLVSVKELLSDYAGKQQAGGKYDAVLMVIGMFIALQMRRIDKAPTFVQKADLLHGFDLAWRDAIRLHVHEAGVSGRLWLFADSCLGTESLRVRMGPVVGDVVELLEFGVGQGRRTGPMFFQALVRPLLDYCASASVGVGLNPPGLGELHAEAAAAGGDNDGEVDWAMVTAFQPVAKSLVGRQLAGSTNWSTRNTMLDVASEWSLLIVQFVDDTFTFVSSSASLRAVNYAMSKFCTDWRHKFQGGRKRPTVMAVEAKMLNHDARGLVCGEVPQEASYLDVLGVPIDNELSLGMLMDRVCARLLQGLTELVNAVEAAGFGFPYACAQCPSRVENSALFGAELLVSHRDGWPRIAQKLNDVQYRMGKQLLGLRASDSLGDGGHVRVLCENRFFTRLSTKVAMRAIMARARLLALPSGSPVGDVLRAAAARCGPTWLDQTRVLTAELGVCPDIVVFPPFVNLDRGHAIERKKVVWWWKKRVVAPQLRRVDEDWFRGQLQKLSECSYPLYRLIVPVGNGFSPGLLWAPWGRCMWRYFKIWCAVRASGGLPLSVCGYGGLASSLPQCPLCGVKSADLTHILAVCSGTMEFRQDILVGSCSPHALVQWLLGTSANSGCLAARVWYVGLCVATIAKCKVAS